MVVNPGLRAAVTAQLIWGFAPLYWIFTKPVPAVDLVAHRVVWSVLLLVVLLLALGRLTATARQLLTGRTALVIAASATAQACNWGIFVWAVTHDRAAEASLGYFLLPLVNVALGLLVLRETVDRAQRIAIGLACIGLAILIAENGGLPWVALGVSLSFGLYGLIRKQVPIGAVEGLAMETALLAPVALAWMWFSGGASLGDYGAQVDLLLLGSAVITTVPLMLYVAGSHRLPLTAMGLVFYIGPTCQLLVAVTLLDQPLNAVQLTSYSLVWLGLGVIIADTFRRYRNVRALARE